MAFTRKQQSGVLRYNPFLRDFELDSSGQGVNTHPIDQRVTILLGMPQESFLPDTNIGNPLKLGRITNDYQERVIDAVRQCLAPLITNGDIDLLDVLVEESKNPTSRSYIGVFYKNLRLETPEVQKVTVNG